MSSGGMTEDAREELKVEIDPKTKEVKLSKIKVRRMDDEELDNLVRLISEMARRIDMPST